MPPHAKNPKPKNPNARTAWAAALAVPLLLALGACSGQANAAGNTDTASPDAPLATTVPAGTQLVVGDPATQVALELSGEIGKFSFPVKFANISGGPQTTEAFRANALDVGAVADIPPIHATWTGLDVRIVASQYRVDAVNFPLYELGIAPGAGIKELSDLRGKKIAYSPGQAQGALVLRILEKAGLKQSDVKLMELPSTGDAYPTALAAKQVDAAPLGGVAIKRYQNKYGPDGGITLRHGLRDDPSHLYTPVKVLQDPAKAAALREYVQHWGVARRWIEDHPKEWLEGYYVKNQGLSAADGQYLIDSSGKADIPTSWTEAIARHQQTIDLLSREQKKPELDARKLYDLRFEAIGGNAFAGAGAKAGATS
jgi:sulfonate transport system substrate-binding protein